MLLLHAIRRFDLAAYALHHGAEPGKRNEWVMVCPSCGKKKLTMNIDRRTWHCWVCEQYAVGDDGKRRPVYAAGGILDLIQFLEKVQREQAIDMVLSGAMFGYEDIDLMPAEVVAEDLMRAYKPAPDILLPESFRPATGILPFCQRRSILDEDIRTFGIGWCDAGRCAGRLIFPVWEEGRFVYYQARAMWHLRAGDVKALNPPAIAGAAVSSEVLMNLDLARHYPRVAIVEGPTDLVRTGSDAVCTFGKQISSAQIARLRRAGVRSLDLMWDADARAAMEATIPLLSSLFDLRVVWLPRGDPGDYSREQLNWFRHYAQPMGGAACLVV
jgi:ribosomal protein L37AE/L43A